MLAIDGVPGAAFGTRDEGNPRNDPAAGDSVSAFLAIPKQWAWVRQVHGNGVVRASGPGIVGEGDGLFTADPAVPVAVSVADCVPVALLAGGAAGMVHAGWRGAAADVVGATIEAMRRAGYPPHTAVIGPGIGPCCFEVGDDVAQQFPSHLATTTWGSRSVDLVAAIRDRLGGVAVHVVAGCTHHEDRFNSYRRDATSERQFGVAWVIPG